MVNQHMTRSWMEVDLDRIRHNFQVIRDTIGHEKEIIAVMKANAYGLGAPGGARALDGMEGLYAMAVSCIDEADVIKAAGVKTPILNMGHADVRLAKRLAELDIIQTLINPQYAKELSDAAVAAGVTLRCHIKVDTGMSRYGIYMHGAEDLQQAADLVQQEMALPNLVCEGLFTHFATADEPDTEFTRVQFSRFSMLLEELKKRGIELPHSHCCNSGGFAYYPECRLNTVRSACIICGWHYIDALKDPMSIRAVITQVKDLKPGDMVGYECTWTAKRQTKAAIIPIGYADGLPFELSNTGHILINGQWAPIIGKVCMDLTIVDVTDIPDVKAGQVVTVFDSDYDSPANIANISSEYNLKRAAVESSFLPRMPRIYFEGGRPVADVSLTGYRSYETK